MLTLSAHGFYWFKLTTDAEAPSWHEQVLSIDERPVLVLFDGWSSLFRDRVVPWRIGMAEKTRLQFETDTLPRFIETQRWYAAKGTHIERARMVDHALWQEGKTSWVLALLQVGGPGEIVDYFMPLALAWEDRDEDRVRNLSTAAVAKVRQQASVGVMGDAFADEMFCRELVAAMAKPREIPTAQGKLQFRPTAAFGQLAGSRFRRLAGGPAAGVELEHGRRHRGTADIEGLSPFAGGRESGTRTRPLSDGGRALPQLCPRGRGVGVCGK